MKKTLTLLLSIVFWAYSVSSSANEDHIGRSSLGMSFKDMLSHFNYDSSEINEGWLIVYKKGKPLFSLNDKNNLQDKVVWNVVITSPNISTEEGIHVGMTVKKLLKIFPKLELNIDDEDDKEYFALPKLEKDTQNVPDAAILIYVESKNGTPLGSGNLGDYPTKKYSTDGVVRYIRVFKTGNSPAIQRSR